MEVLRTIASHKLLAMRAILTGWVVLFLLSYAVERPFLALGYRWIGGASWSTVSVLLDCGALAASGWAVARLHRPWQTAMLVAFTLSLAPFDVASYTGQTMALNLPWLTKLAWNVIGDSRYFTGLLASLASNGLLLACLWAGGRSGSPAEPPHTTLEGLI
jgi:hypothetical protein